MPHVSYEMPHRFEVDLLPDGFYRIFDKEKQLQGFYDQGGMYRSGKLKLPHDFVADTLIGKHKSRKQNVGDYGNSDAGPIGNLGPERASENKKITGLFLYQLIREELNEIRKGHSNFEHNIEFINGKLSNYQLGSWFRTNLPDVAAKKWAEVEDKYIDNYDFGPPELPVWVRIELLEILLEPVKPLYTNKIKKLLGKGAFKFAFLLDNDHVLSIGENMVADFRERDIEPSVYRDMWARQFDPEGGTKVTDIPIYDYDEFGHNMIYIEMGRVETVDMRSARTKRIAREKPENWEDTVGHGLEWIRSAVIYILKNIRDYEERSIGGSLDNWSEEELWNKVMGNVALVRRIKVGLRKATKKEAYAYIKAIIRVAKRHGLDYAIDAHIGNVGFLPHDPSKMTVFDLA
tara:strand:+ start:8379 stop:9587 length:1209 start_codon:yes stop_codon:yes gene_type:complete